MATLSAIYQLEEENRLLRETVEQLKTEIDRFKKTPLMICMVKDIIKKTNSPNTNTSFLISITCMNCLKMLSTFTIFKVSF